MSNTEFKKHFDLMLRSSGFGKKGNKWIRETDSLIQIIELQKSGYTNLYYVNYGYNFKDLDDDDVRFHIFNRHNKEFDLESKTNKNDKIELIKKCTEEILQEMANTNDQNDIVNSLQKRPTLNDIPLRVKEFLKI